MSKDGIDPSLELKSLPLFINSKSLKLEEYNIKDLGEVVLPQLDRTVVLPQLDIMVHWGIEICFFFFFCLLKHSVLSDRVRRFFSPYLETDYMHLCPKPQSPLPRVSTDISKLYMKVRKVYLPQQSQSLEESYPMFSQALSTCKKCKRQSYQGA